VRRRLAPWLLAPVAAAAVACSGGGGQEGDITVFAASSLGDVMRDLGAGFERAHPGTHVRLNVASSATLVTQIREGAPADVFTPASPDEAAALSKEGFLSGTPQTFATNHLAVAVPAGKGPVEAFADLAKPGLRLVLAARDVPAGRYAREALRRAEAAGTFGPGFEAAVLSNVRSEEPSVRAALAKVRLGEADAAIVYVTDVPAGDQEVWLVDVPAAVNVRAEYVAAVLRKTANPGTSADFAAYLVSKEGQAILERAGFGRAGTP